MKLGYKNGKPISKVQKVSSCLMVSIPKHITEKLNIQKGTELLISEENGKIILEKGED